MKLKFTKENLCKIYDKFKFQGHNIFDVVDKVQVYFGLSAAFKSVNMNKKLIMGFSGSTDAEIKDSIQYSGKHYGVIHKQ